MVQSGAQYQANPAEEEKGERKQFTSKTEYEEENGGSGTTSPTPSNQNTTTSNSPLYVPGLPVTQPSSYSSNKATSESDHNGRNSSRSGENASPNSASRQAPSARVQQPVATPAAAPATASAAHAAATSTGNHYWSHHGPNPAAYNGAANRGYHHGNTGYGPNHGHHLQPPNISYNKENNYYGVNTGYNNNQNSQVNPKRQHYNVATHQYRWGYVDDTLDDIPPPRVRGNTTNAQMKARQQQQSEQYWYAANSYYHNSNHWSDDAPPGDEPIQLEKPLETMSQPVVGRLYHQQLFSRGKQLLETLPTSKKRMDYTGGRRGSPSPQDQAAMDAITSKLSETRVEQKQAELAAASAVAAATAAAATETEVAHRVLGRAPPPALAPLNTAAGQEVDREHADSLHVVGSEEVTPDIRITRPSGDMLNAIAAIPLGMSAPGLNRGVLTYHPQHEDLQDSKGSLVGSLCSSAADGASRDGKKGYDITMASDEFADCLSDGSCDEITSFAAGPMGWFESPSSPSEQSNPKNSPRPNVK